MTSPPPALFQLILQEARSVAAWITLASFFRVFLSSLGRFATRDCGPLVAVLSTATRLVLSTMPVESTGFIYACPWILLFVKHSFGSFPNIALRVTEMMLGRITLRQLVALLPFHFLCALSSLMVLERVVSEEVHEVAFQPIRYANGTSWTINLASESFVNAILSVTILVLPSLFSLNKIPIWSFTFLLIPLFTFGVDSQGNPSTFAPNVLLSLGEDKSDVLVVTRIAGSLMGGIVGGLVMRRFFPDDDKP